MDIFLDILQFKKYLNFRIDVESKNTENVVKFTIHVVKCNLVLACCAFHCKVNVVVVLLRFKLFADLSEFLIC